MLFLKIISSQYEYWGKVPHHCKSRFTANAMMKQAGINHTIKILSIGTIALLLLFPVLSTARVINYLYIEASEGNASGGHTAIQFENEIYHYQHIDEGIIHLERDETPDFEFHYRFENNRNIHRSRLQVSAETYHVLRDAFNFRYLLQQQQLALLNSSYQDSAFIEHLLNPETTEFAPELIAAGLFYATDKPLFSQNNFSSITQKLTDNIAQHYGKSFLSQRKHQLETQLKQLTPIQWNSETLQLSDQNYKVSLFH